MRTLIITVIALATLSLQAQATAQPNPWSLLAQRDLEAMRAQIMANHPGPVDPLNPEFKVWLEDGFAKAMAKAREVRTFGGYVYALRYYGAGFRDGHLNSGVMLTQSEVAWPGFLVALRNGRYLVASVQDAAGMTLPPVGSEVVDCDGRSPRAIVEQDIWPYAMGPMVESQWQNIAPGMLLDRGNPWVASAKSCRFRIGEKVEVRELRYRTISSDALNTMTRAIFTVPEQPVARKVGSGGVWVSLPAFYTGTPGTLERLREAVALAPQWRNAPFVVFDVRNNGGGNSAWGDQILDGLYGKAFVDRTVRSRFAGQYVDWRVSPDNLAHVRDIVATNEREQGPDSRTAKYFRPIAKGLEEALAKGLTLYRRAEEEQKPDPSRTPAPLYRGKVVLLTDTRCGSACLDFADLVRRLPNSTHAGIMTAADSVYMEVRSVVLPSGTGRLAVPVKVYRNRPRGHNEPYVPHAPYTGDITDTPALERFVLGLLEDPSE